MRLSRRCPQTPRPVSALEAAVVRRVLHLEAARPHIDALLRSVDQFTVREGCECGCDVNPLAVDLIRNTVSTSATLSSRIAGITIGANLRMTLASRPAISA